MQGETPTRLEYLTGLDMPSNRRVPLHAYLEDVTVPAEFPSETQHISMAMVATRNYLPFARVLASSFSEFHPEIPVRLLLVDGGEADRNSLPDVTIDLLPDLGLDHAYWYATKFNATQFANAIKPVYLTYLGHFAERLIYFDTDVAVFARVDVLLTALETHDVVAIPHTYAPFDKPERYWVHPTTADIFNSGLINAGCFAIRPSNCTEFLAFWERSNLGPGTFYNQAGGQTDQQYFNWAPLMVDRFLMLKDRAYNVAYWNLHERGLRSTALDGDAQGWTVDGHPLVFFHFSGYNPRDTLALSRHDGRYVVYNMPAVADILAWYSEQLFSCDYVSQSVIQYRFDRLANGIRLNSYLREILKKYEAYTPKFNAQSINGADRLCAFLMTPLPATGSLLPLLAAEIYEARPDLRSGFPNAHTAALHSHRYWTWFLENAGKEYDLQDIISRFRQILVSDALVGFSRDVEQLLNGLGAPLKFLGVKRGEAADTLRSFGKHDIAATLMGGRCELPFSTPLSAILAIWTTRQDLQTAHPYVFGASHPGFLTWLTEHGVTEYNLPEDAVETFRDRAWNISLARLFSFCARREELGELAHRQLLADAPWDLVRELIRGAGEGLEYDLADVEVMMFLHRYERHVLVPFYLELPMIRRMALSSRLASNRVAMLPADSRETQWAVYGCRLHGTYFDDFSAYLEDEIKQKTVVDKPVNKTVGGFLRANDKTREAAHVLATAFETARSRYMKAAPSAEVMPPPLSDSRKHVNVFGFFHADTGVGESTRGLANAAQQVASVRRVPLCTGSVTAGVRLHQLFQKFDYAATCNVIVSYPHQSEDFFGVLPRDYMAGRANIIHLAWEQRDWNACWRDVYDRYDEIWMISEFAALPFRQLFGDKVRVVPNVVSVNDVSIGPSGRDGDRFRFTFVFDANSSMERKNPEGVLQAFVQAFAGTPQSEDVELYLKVGNLDRIEHAARIEALRGKARRSGLNIIFDGRVLTRSALLSLVAHSDCYVSLHRSEGFGYTMAEAMWYGVPVIASGYSGNLEYMDETNSFLVPCKETLVKEADGPFQRGSVWGDPNINDAADLFRSVLENRDHARSVGKLGESTVRSKLNPAAVAERLLASPLIGSL